MEIEQIVGSICQEEWSSFSGMYTTEETHHMAQLHGNYIFPVNDLEDCCSYGLQPTFWPNHDSTMNPTTIDETTFWPTEITYPNSHSLSQMTNSHDSDDSNTPIFHNPIWATTDGSISMDVSMSNIKNSSSLYLIKGNDRQNQKMCEADESNGSLDVVVFTDDCTPIRWGGLVHPSSAEDGKNDSRDSRKRSQLPEDKMKRNVTSKRIQRLDFSSTSDEDGIAQPNGQSSSTSYSDDPSSSPKLKGGASSSSKEPAILNLNGKTRASRGSATDPQSLYARIRRERVNEGLRTLQNLVPNGTKVDISTILEEAVHYVKFLQLQIKLLSSDELWMYAPIAYNGM